VQVHLLAIYQLIRADTWHHLAHHIMNLQAVTQTERVHEEMLNCMGVVDQWFQEKALLHVRIGARGMDQCIA